MATLTIQIPEKELKVFKEVLKKFRGKVVESFPEDKVPNAETLKAIEDAKAGKTQEISDARKFFASI